MLLRTKAIYDIMLTEMKKPLKTSKIVLCPNPGLKPEEYATIRYGGITIKMDESILRKLVFLSNSLYDRSELVFKYGIQEMLTEMYLNTVEHMKVESVYDIPQDISFRDNRRNCSVTNALLQKGGDMEEYSKKHKIVKWKHI